MTRKITHVQRIAVVLALALAWGGCDSDSPTAPSVTPSAAPPPTASASWRITVTADPSAISLDSLVELGNTATITITVRRSDNGQVPPQGATVVVSATPEGILTAGSTSGTEIPVALDAGRAVATLTLPSRAISIVVRARLEQNVGQTTVRVLETPAESPLFIESVIPASGPPSGGTEVRIQGSGFDPPVRVTFGGIFAEVVSVSSSVIRVMTPAVDLPVGGTSTVAVTVTINVNDPEDPTASDTLANAFTYARAGETLSPSIISISPTSGPNEGGTQVTIFGENFADAVQVFFGTSALIEAPVISVSPTRLVVETPSATGPNSSNQNSIVGVRVVNVASGAFAQLASAFQYGTPGGSVFISSAGPTEGFYFGGTNVTIFGQGFDEPVAVEFGTRAQQVISVTGTEIIARSVPIEMDACTDISGAFSVVNIETNETATSPIQFTYKPVEPAISSISPPEIPIVTSTRDVLPPGARATISGGGFDFPVRVTFGDATASVVDGSVILDPAFDPRYGIASAFDVFIPRYLGTFGTADCTDAFGNEGTVAAPTTVSVTVENLPTTCSDTFANSFTYVPVQADGSPPECEVGGNPPTASFSFSVDVETVTFTDTSTESPTSWEWDFGDGATSTLQNPVHTYPPGVATYTVTLVASNQFGPSDPFTATVTTAPNPPPVASFVVTVNGLEGIFTDTSTGGPTSWLWNFGDGSPTSTLQHPVHEFPPASATYNVTLVASSAFGSSDPFTMPVTIIAPPPPTAAFTFTVDDLVASFIDTSTDGPTSWEWDFGDGGSSTVQNPSHTYAQVAATYDVTLTATNDFGSDSVTQQVTIEPQPPVANFSFTVSNLTATFTDLSTGMPTSWVWDFGDGEGSTAQNPSHTFPAMAMTWNVTLTATSAFGSSVPFTRPVTIVP